MLGFQLDWTGEGLSYSSDSVSTTPRLDRYHDHLHVSCNFCGAKVAGRPATGPIHSLHYLEGHGRSRPATKVGGARLRHSDEPTTTIMYCPVQLHHA